MIMKRWRKQIFIVLVGLFGLGIGYVFCIPCQFFGWMPMPSVGDVLANPETKPKTIGAIFVLSKMVCVSIEMKSLIKRNPEREFYQDFMEQFSILDSAYQQTVRLYVDGFRPVVLFSSLMIQSRSASPCVETDGLGQGKHVSHISFEAPLGRLHEYTWVFEVKPDGIVPEVTATLPA